MKTSLLMCAGAATSALADYRPVADGLNKGKYYLRLLNTSPDALKALADEGVTEIVPELQFGELSLNPGLDQANPFTDEMFKQFPAEVLKLYKIAYGMPTVVLFVSPDHYMTAMPEAFTSTAPKDYAKDMKLTPAEVPAVPVTTASNWGLQFLAGAQSLTGSGAYQVMGNGGEGIDVYVVGTGMNVDHPQLKGRAERLYTAPGLDAKDQAGTGTAQAGIVLDMAPKVNKFFDLKVADTVQPLVSVNDLYKACGNIMKKVAATKRLSVVDFGALVGYKAAGTAESNLVRFLGANSKGLVHPSTNTNYGDIGACSGIGGGQGLFPYISTGGVYPNGMVVYENTADVKMPYSGLGPCNYVMAPGFNIRSFAKEGSGAAYVHGPPAATAFTTGMIAGILSTYPTLTTVEVRTLVQTAAVPAENFWEKDTAYFPNTAQRSFNLDQACRSLAAPSIPDAWCRNTKCDKKSLGVLCELSATKTPTRQCSSLVKHIPDSWCQATACDKAYASLCAWKCTA